jgi:hypothetical protein
LEPNQTVVAVRTQTTGGIPGPLPNTRDSLSNVASSEDQKDGEDEDHDEEDTGHVKLSDDHEPGWVTGTICNAVLHRMEGFQQTQLRLDQLRPPGWGVRTTTSLREI